MYHLMNLRMGILHLREDAPFYFGSFGLPLIEEDIINFL